MDLLGFAWTLLCLLADLTAATVALLLLLGVLELRRTSKWRR